MKLSKTVLFTILFLLLALPVFFALNTSGEEYAPSTPWMPPDDYVDPVRLKVQELKEKGLSDAQIIIELKKLGMGWNPSTDETWFGTILPPEEEAKLPTPGKASGEEYAPSTPWMPPDDYVDPVRLKVQELKGTGLQDAQIITELEELGMGWNPSTDETWFGTTLSPEEEAKLPTPVCAQRDSLLGTDSQIYTGFSHDITCGSAVAASGETDVRYITTHVGSGGFWTEVGIYRHEGGFDFFTYDNDANPKFGFHGASLGYYPNPNSYYWFEIIVTSETNASGHYRYNIFIDGTFVRTGFLPNRLNGVDDAHECFSDDVATPPLVWSNDNAPAVFQNQYLVYNDNWLHWTDQNAPSSSYAMLPLHHTTDDSSGTFTFKSWSGFRDEFNDASIATSRWSELETNSSTVSEYGQALRVYVPQGVGQAQAGYVTTNSYTMNGAQVEVNVPNFDELDEMILNIGLTKTTSSDPYFESSWYRILKARYDGNIYVQRRVNGGAITTLHTEAYGSTTGTLKIKVSGGTISFYDGNDEVYSQSYALSSYNCYLYAFTSTLGTRNHGTDFFDDFEYYLLAP